MATMSGGDGKVMTFPCPCAQLRRTRWKSRTENGVQPIPFTRIGATIHDRLSPHVRKTTKRLVPGCWDL